MLLKLLSNDLAKLLDVILVVYQKDQSIVFQVASSLSLLVHSKEGLTYLNNTNDLISHLKQILTMNMNTQKTNELIMMVLVKLGCVITFYVCSTT